MRHFLVLLAAAFLAACTATQAAAAGAATAATVPIFADLLKSWLDAGLLSPQQYAEVSRTMIAAGETMEAVLQVVGIWGKQVQEAQSSGVSTEALVGAASGATVVGAAVGKALVTRERGPVYARKGAAPKG